MRSRPSDEKLPLMGNRSIDEKSPSTKNRPLMGSRPSGARGGYPLR
jgi:hypothetical protein